jgi:hypothetical protein
MKFGPGELILILIIAFVVLLVVRVIKTAAAPRPEPEEDTTPRYTPPNRPSPRLKAALTGLGIILLGIVVLFSSLSLVKWVFWGPVGAIIAMIAGAVILVLASRR